MNYPDYKYFFVLFSGFLKSWTYTHDLRVPQAAGQVKIRWFQRNYFFPYIPILVLNNIFQVGKPIQIRAEKLSNQDQRL